jgi:hydroxyacylglutathione hydrolase
MNHYSLTVNSHLTIHYFPVLDSNYTFVMHDTKDNICAVVDPAIAEPVIQLIKKLDSKLVAIFNTHHHHDHIGGNRQLQEKYPDLMVYGGEHDRGRIPHQQVFLTDNQQLKFANISIHILFIPAHTLGHIAYFLPESNDVFCGDTLFGCGCGRLFEGTPQHLLNALQKLAQLPEQTRVWCAHEYTLKNLQFAMTINPENIHLLQRFTTADNQRKQNLPTIPSTIALEKLTNPFLRWHDPDIQKNIAQTDPVRLLGKLRGMRDLF